MMLRMWGNQSATTGKLDDAVLHWRASLAFRMDDAGLHNDLGAILARLGRVREAIPEFEAAVRLDPKMDSARRNLETARAHVK
jgi:Flp pilus assembly protein TadD